MNYSASITDYFKSPKWVMNTLLAGVCVFIPFVGQIVIKGWLITGFWGREEERSETFPDFDFNNFGKYLERGLWPFLVTLVSSLVLGLVMAVVIVPVMMIFSLALPGHNSQASGCAAVFMFGFMVVFYLAMIVAIMFLLTPLTLRATITQDFGQSFNFAFIKRFVTLMWKEILLSSLFQLVAGMVLVCIGALALCVGMYFAIVPAYFCWIHLHKQLYRLYLSRGGEPISLSPKLRDYPAPAPAA
ncbi:MAG: hypothetical protein DLM73_00990 [Chthoniobacterales bacterium]|nr:MAG: hypothetical protein DLM73_00990 [Chthoniobacterales bacterium]